MYNNIKINSNNGILVNIERGNAYISKYELDTLEDQVNDLLKFKTKYKKDETIKLSNLCDFMHDLMFCGINKERKEIMFKIC
jgi:hypothetical protein